MIHSILICIILSTLYTYYITIYPINIFISIYSGWWYSYPSEKYWKFVTWDDYIFPIWWENHQNPWFQTINQLIPSLIPLLIPSLTIINHRHVPNHQPAIINPIINHHYPILTIINMPYLSEKKPRKIAPVSDCQQLKACRACCVLPERCASPPASTSSTDAGAARARRAATAQPELPEPMTMKS